MFATGRDSFELLTICAVAAIVIGLLNITGLALSLGLALVKIGEGSMILLLIAVALVCFILGLGLPTTGVYLLVAILAAPPLVKLGVPPMAAHMFVLFHGCLSMITPPIALAAYAAAHIAGADHMRVGWIACRLGWPLFVLPFLFAWSPELLWIGTPANIAMSIVFAFVGTWLMCSAIAGYLLEAIGRGAARARRHRGDAAARPGRRHGAFDVPARGRARAGRRAGRSCPAIARAAATYLRESAMIVERRRRFAARIREPRLVSAPGVYDLISAKLADRMGFDALYMTGYGVVASHLGLPDAGLATYSDMVDRVGQIAAMTQTPLVADGDTGYGGLLNVQHTVRGYESAGAVAIQLEDQEFPKKCGHMLGRRVVPAADMAAKIRVAVESRSDPNFLIIARTDSRTTLGLDEALRRAEAYLEAGADLLFVESPESVDEMERIGRTFDVPLVANMVEGGRTPILDAATLQKLGYRLAIFPALGFLAAGAVLEKAYAGLKARGSSVGLDVPLYPFKDFSALMGFDWVAEFDRKHRDA